MLTNQTLRTFADEAFMILWEASSTVPDFVPFVIADIDSLEKDHRGPEADRR